VGEEVNKLEGEYTAAVLGIEIDQVVVE